jgi:hypothetical protein
MTIPWSFEPSPYSPGGEWVKCGFHCHTVNSDGGLSPAETVRIYREAGFRCLGISDHAHVTPMAEFSGEGFLGIDSVENRGEPDILAVGVRAPAPEEWTLAERATALAAQGAFTIAVHPHYCAALPSDYLGCEGLHAIEIYNAYCDHAYANGLATEMWDMLLGQGMRVWGVAGDDAHLNPKKRYYSHAGLAWVEAWCAGLTREAVLAALHAGAFYSTQGPRFERIEVGERTLRIACTPVVEVRWRTYGKVGFVDYAASPDELLTASALPDWFTPRRYVRVELVDRAGRRAWSNPLFVTH